MQTHWLAFGTSVMAAATVWAASGTTDQPTRTLSLAQCRQLALERNLNFRISRFGPQSSWTAIATARATFDPSFTAGAAGSRTQAPDQLWFDASTASWVSKSQPVQRNLGSSIGVGKNFAFGTNMGLDLSNGWSSGSGLSNYASRVRFSVSQPLLKGFGREVNESGIRLARNNRDISLSQLESDAISTTQQVEEAYWDLVNAIEGRKVAELSLEYAQQLLERSRVRAESGAQAQREVLQAEAGVAIARQAIISADAAVRAAEDRLKQLTNLTSDPNGWDLSLVPLDTPHVAAALAPVDTLLATALGNSRELYRMEKSLESRRLSLRVRKNALLPSLNASTGLTLNDGSASFSNSLDDIAKGSFPSWSAGLSLSVPIGNRRAEAEYRQASIDLQSTGLQLESLRQQIHADVRSAVRRVETSRQQMAAAMESRRLQEANLESEQERLRLGLSTNYDVLRLEKDLADARRAVLQARIEHEKALLALDVATGRLLEVRNITIAGE